jgi:hypothetical protein
VRNPESNEKNANILLIQKGATAVDYNGIETSTTIYAEQTSPIALLQESLVSIDDVNERILKVFNGKPLSAKEILEKSGLDWTPRKLTIQLQKMEEVQVIKIGKTNQFTLKSSQVNQPTLFE